jgi:hypothetical protein
LIGGLAISALTLASLRPTAVPPQEQHTAPKLRAVLAATPALPVMLVVVLAGNLASGGVFAVALPVLAHQRFGTSGYGLLLAALAAGRWPAPRSALNAAIRPRREQRELELDVLRTAHSPSARCC